jgi:hypothetical protein
MNEYGALVEWYWQGKAEVLREKTVRMPLYTTNPTRTGVAIHHLGHDANIFPFDPGSVRVGFVVDKVILGQFFPRVLRFSPVSFIPPMLHYLEEKRKN